MKVIELIPRNQDQDAVWNTLEGSLCEHEDVADMKTLGRFQARLPYDLAKALEDRSNIYAEKASVLGLSKFY